MDYIWKNQYIKIMEAEIELLEEELEITTRPIVRNILKEVITLRQKEIDDINNKTSI